MVTHPVAIAVTQDRPRLPLGYSTVDGLGRSPAASAPARSCGPCREPRPPNGRAPRPDRSRHGWSLRARAARAARADTPGQSHSGSPSREPRQASPRTADATAPAAASTRTEGRRTYSAGECSSSPSITQMRWKPATHRQPPRHRRGREPAMLLHPPHVQLDVRARIRQRIDSVLAAPDQKRPTIRLGVHARLTLERSQVSGRGTTKRIQTCRCSRCTQTE